MNKRIQSIDLLRGLVMVIMALDHVRDYINFGYLNDDPTNIDTTTPSLFFTRWITHFCAPVFVFLSGTSAFLYGSKRTKKEITKFLFTRGLWLIFIELTVVNFAWTFDISLGVHILQVIWAIGLCMICLSFLIYIPIRYLLGIGILLVAGHNLLDSITAKGSHPFSILWYILHQQQFLKISDNQLFFLAYPIIPWLGLMILGYCFGTLYKKEADINTRKKWLLRLGISSIILFIILRSTNIYGDLAPWSQQKNFIYTLLSFLNTTKYPPSLIYILMTIGPALLFLYFSEKVQNRMSKILVIIGRVPFYYYILHLYLIHIFGIIGLLILGEDWREIIYTPQRFMSGYLANKGFDLWVTYLVWVLVIIILYPLCKKYQEYKANNPDKWWLSYL